MSFLDQIQIKEDTYMYGYSVARNIQGEESLIDLKLMANKKEIKFHFYLTTLDYANISQTLLLNKNIKVCLLDGVSILIPNDSEFGIIGSINTYDCSSKYGGANTIMEFGLKDIKIFNIDELAQIMVEHLI